MKFKTLAIAAASLAFVASQASIAAAEVSAPVKSGVVSGVKRAGVPMKKSHEFAVFGASGILLGYVVGGVFIAAAVATEAQKNDGPTSP